MTVPNRRDVVLELDGLQVYVETSILQQLGGTVIDYVSELQGASFRFSNPNATGTCGCGTSFFRVTLRRAESRQQSDRHR